MVANRHSASPEDSRVYWAMALSLFHILPDQTHIKYSKGQSRSFPAPQTSQYTTATHQLKPGEPLAIKATAETGPSTHGSPKPLFCTNKAGHNKSWTLISLQVCVSGRIQPACFWICHLAYSMKNMRKETSPNIIIKIDYSLDKDVHNQHYLKLMCLLTDL